jgi:hypothetical protein
MRDNFSPDVKRALEQRAGHRCCFPGCDAETSGPSNEGPRAVARTGMACHIVAASSGPGARRIDGTMSSAQRSSYENGIWMCHHHGTLIDQDESRFTIPLLIQWREAAEKRAAIRQAQRHFDSSDFSLFKHELIVTSANLDEKTIGHAFIDAGISAFWGQSVASAVRDFAFEIVQNALTHGGANSATISFFPRTILISDDGAIFDPRDLPSIPNARGGRMAFEALRSTLENRLMFSVRHEASRNLYQVQYIRTQSDLKSESPCAVSFKHEIQSNGVFDEEAISRTVGCETIYILLPDYLSYSKTLDFMQRLPESVSGRDVVFVGSELSKGVIDLLGRLRGSIFIDLPPGADTHFYQDD